METRKEYIERLAAKLREWDEKIDDLKIQVETAAGDAKVIYKKKLLELREFRERAAVLLEEAREATDATWKDVRKRLDNLLDSVKKSLKKAA